MTKMLELSVKYLKQSSEKCFSEQLWTCFKQMKNRDPKPRYRKCKEKTKWKFYS